jgi:polysaccharide export outer membrane protein
LGPTANLSARTARQTSLLALAAGLASVLGGCTADLDHYLDPSEVGRYEATPTSVPILDRITAIEGPADQFVEVDEVRADDLRAEASEYRLSAGDGLEVRIYDIIQPGVPEIYPLLVDTRGIIMIPQLGEIALAGQTVEQARQSIANIASGLVREPLVQVTVTQSRKQTFTILGAVAGPGTYFIPSADYRLLEAITVAGGVPETIPSLYVIRQIPLTAQPTSSGPTGAGQGGGEQGEGFIDLLDNLTGDGGGSPAVISAEWQPEQPAVDLVEGDAPAGSQAGDQPASAWIFVNGEWVRAARADSTGAAAVQPDALVTQRVIRVSVRQLLSGDARANIVVRPGDVLRVPPPEQGFVYIGGNITRPGSYNLPVTGPYTLRRAIISAADLAPTGIPERCDLTRMVGENRQATIMLNYRAIVEGTQPDVVLKPNDIIEIGTTFWAYPLAVFRNGFRATYGFGFLLDRNFGNDVFGAPPTNYTDR